MRRLVLAAALFCVGAFCLAQSDAQVPLTGAGLGIPHVPSGGGLALDGTPGYSQTSVNGSNQFSVTGPTTSNATDIVILLTQTANTTSTISGVSGCGLTWTSRYNTLGNFQEYYAIAGATLSGCSITVTTSAAQFQAAAGLVFGISGANTSVPFDTNGAIPAYTSSYNTSPSVSTSANDTFIFSIGSPVGTVSPGSGFVNLETDATNNLLAQYQIYSTTKSSLSMSATGGGYYQALADAVKKVGE